MKVIELKPHGNKWLMLGPGFEDHSHPSKEIAIDHAKKVAQEQGHDEIILYDNNMNVKRRIAPNEIGVK